MSSTTRDYNITLAYTDGTSRKITFPKIDQNVTSPTAARTKIKAINDGTATGAASFKSTFVSDDGAPVDHISKAQLVTTIEEVIYDGN